MPSAAINLFYEEPDPDRWLPFDRFPRRIVRNLVRGPRRPGGQMRVFLNLRAGLDRIGARYRVNDFHHARRNPSELACVVGKSFVLDRMEWRNPILFGASIFSHPIDDPKLLERRPVVRVLVPGPWMRDMFDPWFGERVHAWPVGIDTDRWSPAPEVERDIDVLIYDKVRWDYDRLSRALIGPVRDALSERGLRVATLRYGEYGEADFLRMLHRSRSMVFLCEHETQGIAYQQALSAGVPVLAWDRGGCWYDPNYFPQVRFGPVTSVPYWDERCGVRFEGITDFDERLGEFLEGVRGGRFAPRDYILENLTLERCAQEYLQHVQAVA